MKCNASGVAGAYGYGNYLPSSEPYAAVRLMTTCTLKKKFNIISVNLDN